MLLNSLDDIKQYITVSVTSSFQSIEPYIKRAERKYIVPTISQPQYDELDNGSSLSSKQEDALNLLQEATAFLAYYLYIPELQVHISDQGINIITSEHKKTAFPWQIQKLEEHWFTTGMDLLEEALILMENNRTEFTKWENSDAFTIFRDHFIATADEFESIYPIQGSRRMFLKLKPIMKQVEEDAINPVLCDDLYDEVLKQIKDQNLSSKNKKLLPYIKNAIVYKTIEQAIGELAVDVTPNGLTLTSTMAQNENVKETKPANTGRLTAYQENAKNKADKYLKQLKQYLNNKVDTYPLYKNSDCYTEDANQQVDNKDSNVIFF